MSDELDQEAERTALLAAFARSRDEAAFRRLYRAFTPMLYGFAMRLCASRPDSEELVQETWSRALARQEAFAGSSRYGTWLVGILINVYRENRRRALRLVESDDVAGDEFGAVAGSGIETAGTIDLERALQALPVGYRLVLILHDVNGCTHEEIAGLLGVSDGTSKSQLARGRARLRQLLGVPEADGSKGIETSEDTA